MADYKGNKQKEKYLESTSKTCPPRREWKEYFMNLLGNPLEIMNKPTKEIINGQQDIKCGQFMKEELDAILKQ